MDKIDNDTITASSNLIKIHNKDANFAQKGAESTGCSKIKRKRKRRKEKLL